LTPYVDIFRLGSLREISHCPDIDGPLKILMAVAAPWKGETGAVLDYERELGNVMDIAETVPGFGNEERRPIIHILDQGTLKDICEAFEYNRYHILHISCHGKPGILYLEDEDGAVDEVRAKNLVRGFPAGRCPVLTVLSACHSGAAGKLASFATHLIQNGFPYVIAMQEALSDSYAIQFASALYKHLAYAENPVIEDALTKTLLDLEEERNKTNRRLSDREKLPPEWMTPTLYKGSVERHAIFEPRPERYDRRMEMPTEDFDPGISHRQIGEFVGRRRKLLTLKNDVLAKRQGGAALVTGMGGVGKSTLVARALGDWIRKGKRFDLVPVVGRISLVNLLQKLGCQGQELEQLLADFFGSWLPEKGRNTVFLLDNFEENLVTPNATRSVNGGEAFAIEDATVAQFLADLVYSGKSRILITCRFPFELPDRQHRLFTAIELGALSPAETRKLMIRLKGFDSLGPEDRHRVVRYIGGHPRTLEFLDAILRDGKFTYDDVQKRLLKKLPADALDRLNKKKDLTGSLQEAVAVAARDCFVDQLLELLSEPEKELLFLLSVFEEPRPRNTLQWLIDKQELKVDMDAVVEKLVRLSLFTPYAKDYAVHRWTAEYLRETMGEAFWKLANHLAGDHYYGPEKIPLSDGLSAWRHYLNSEDLDTANKVAAGLEDKLDTWGHWDLRRIVCETMLAHTHEKPALYSRWLHNTGILQQDQGDYDGAREQYQKSLEIKEKLGDLSGMASTYGQLGLFMKQMDQHSEAFGYFLQAFLIFTKLKAPAAQQALGDLCKVAIDHQDQWQEWLVGLVEDRNNRSQLEKLILQNMKSPEEQKAEAIMQMKVMYDQMGEEKFIEFIREQTGENPPYELLKILRLKE
jgi:tetratricopeptide (TPR) repeat protein